VRKAKSELRPLRKEGKAKSGFAAFAEFLCELCACPPKRPAKAGEMPQG